jgi:hypothetical protein
LAGVVWQVLVGPGGLLRGWRRVQQRRGNSSSAGENPSPIAILHFVFDFV